MFRFESPLFFNFLFIAFTFLFKKNGNMDAIKISSLNLFGEQRESKKLLIL